MDYISNKSAVVFNIGCKVNQYECDSLTSSLISLGFSVYNHLVLATVYIINTCAVTSEAERKSRQIISRIRNINPNAMIFILGCASEKNKSFYYSQNVDYVGGTTDHTKIFDFLNDTNKSISTPPALPITTRTRAYVKLQDGCDKMCSYCVIPILRGAPRSKPIKDATREIYEMSKLANEIVLVGINLSLYGKDTNESLPMLFDKIKDVAVRIRLSSFYQDGISYKLLDSLFSLKEFSPHFHLSLQHGSVDVLKDMNRSYTPEEYLKSVSMIRKYDKNAAITTDIIVGYPTETDDLFLESEKFLEEVKFSDIHIFPFSKREGTKAANLAQLPADVVKKRRLELESLRHQLRISYLEKMLSIPQTVLFETQVDEIAEGYSQYYVRVYAKTTNKKENIMPHELYKRGLKGGVL